jgi:hypothetical protein
MIHLYTNEKVTQQIYFLGRMTIKKQSIAEKAKVPICSKISH